MINADNMVRWVIPSECTVRDCALPQRFSLEGEGEEKERHSHYKKDDNCCYLIKASYEPNQIDRPLTAVGFASLQINHSKSIKHSHVSHSGRFRKVRYTTSVTTQTSHLTKRVTETASADALVRIKREFSATLNQKFEGNLPNALIEIIVSYDERMNDSWIIVNEILKGFENKPLTSDMYHRTVRDSSSSSSDGGWDI